MNLFWSVFIGVSAVVLTGLLLYLRKQDRLPSFGSTANPGKSREKSGDHQRRNFLKISSAGLLSLLGVGVAADQSAGASVFGSTDAESKNSDVQSSMKPGMGVVGKVDPEENDFDPMDMLVDWDYGDEVKTMSNGQTLRIYNWDAIDKTITIAPGVEFPAWTYEGRVPGPTIRCKEGDRIRINFRNKGSHPHTIHFHGIHSFKMDGEPEAGPGNIAPGEEFTYEFDAKPFGCHLYHCHSIPLKRHIHKGLYGAFIVDPAEKRPPARELMMMMNGFDTNFDGDNEVYAVNTVAHEFMHRKIPAKVGETIRIYLINVVEFDAINSFHPHANFFDYYDHGTSLEPDREMLDTIMQTQAQRGIIELTYNEPGQYMFHAHQSEFAELGWMGRFNVVHPKEFDQALNEAGIGNDWNQRALEGSTS